MMDGIVMGSDGVNLDVVGRRPRLSRNCGLIKHLVK